MTKTSLEAKLRDLLAAKPCTSKPQYLTVKGKTYEGVRGLKPFYLKIPESDSILFITEDSRSAATFHVVNWKTGGVVEIHTGTSGFGWAIGSGRKAGEKMTDYIEWAGSNRIAVATRSLRWKSVEVLNLRAESIERIETTHYDELEKMTNYVATPIDR